VGVDPNERGWKDTVRVMGNETVTVIAKFPDAPELFGHFPYHCHVLEHEDYDMMRQFVLDQTPV
jgi:spore coat protein A